MQDRNEINKIAKHKLDEITKIWLGLSYLFQTFESLESVKDRPADIQAVRQMLDEGQLVQEKNGKIAC